MAESARESAPASEPAQSNREQAPSARNQIDPASLTGPVWTAARAVIAHLRSAGHEAQAVGGAVRDLVLGRPVHDVDVATDAVPDRVEALFPRTVAVGKAFGVVIVLQGDQAVEVATYRADGPSSDGRRPDAVRFGDVVEDVRRRDLTINALLMDPETGRISDLVGGLADLRAGLVRTVGDPLARFSEDRLRLLRALRFAAHLGFTIEPQTWTGLVAVPLTGLSAERIIQEWDKALAGPHPERWLALLGDSGRLTEALPLRQASAATLARLARIRPGDHPDLAAAVCLSDADPAERQGWLERQPLAKDRARRLAWLWDNASDPERLIALPIPARRRLFQQNDATLLADLLVRWHGPSAAVQNLIDQIGAERQAAFTTWITASDLLGLGMTPGPALGRTLRSLEDRQLSGEFPDRVAALAAARVMAAG
ncbi:CCA-adding enzyme [Planctomycetota bacterium]|nr:CCA-adding enzyme [Planctomycetota bacterium]